MRKLIVLFVLGTSSVALAEDCSCLDDKRLTKSCVDFTFTDEFLECQNINEDDRVSDLEDRVDAVEAQLRKVRAAQKKAAKNGN